MSYGCRHACINRRTPLNGRTWDDDLTHHDPLLHSMIMIRLKETLTTNDGFITRLAFFNRSRRVRCLSRFSVALFLSKLLTLLSWLFNIGWLCRSLSVALLDVSLKLVLFIFVTADMLKSDEEKDWRCRLGSLAACILFFSLRALFLVLTFLFLFLPFFSLCSTTYERTLCWWQDRKRVREKKKKKNSFRRLHPIGNKHQWRSSSFYTIKKHREEDKEAFSLSFYPLSLSLVLCKFQATCVDSVRSEKSTTSFC